MKEHYSSEQALLRELQKPDKLDPNGEEVADLRRRIDTTIFQSQNTAQWARELLRGRLAL